MTRLTTIELIDPRMNFSAGHFTIFSKTERESLHGHNYQVGVTLVAELNQPGLNFDYRFYKKKIYELCGHLNLLTLLPENSPYLRLEDEGEYLCAYFHDEKLPFLKRDVVILPLTNITLEELSHYFLMVLMMDQASLDEHCIQSVAVKVSNGPGTWGGSEWQRKRPQ